LTFGLAIMTFFTSKNIAHALMSAILFFFHTAWGKRSSERAGNYTLGASRLGGKINSARKVPDRCYHLIVTLALPLPFTSKK
jgi:hypothetical protein